MILQYREYQDCVLEKDGEGQRKPLNGLNKSLTLLTVSYSAVISEETHLLRANLEAASRIRPKESAAVGGLGAHQDTLVPLALSQSIQTNYTAEPSARRLDHSCTQYLWNSIA